MTKKEYISPSVETMVIESMSICDASSTPESPKSISVGDYSSATDNDKPSVEDGSIFAE